MKVLITGGAGFIGSHFVKYFLKKHPGDTVINLDKLTYAGHLENLAGIDGKRYRFVKGDICDDGLVNEAMSGCDMVVNFAAETHVDRSIENPADFVKTNIYGVYVLLESARKSKIKKFLQISTDEVYGSILRGAFTEDSKLNPGSPYSASKASADLLALSYFNTFRMPVVIVRSSNNFGFFQYPEKMIPLFVTNALDNVSLPVYGDGRNVRDWIYVEDNCRAIDLVLAEGKDGEIYNVCGENARKNVDMAKFILKALKKPDTLIEFVKDRAGHDRRYAIKCDKIRKLGYKLQGSFEEKLSKTIEWYRENENWWRKFKK